MATETTLLIDLGNSRLKWILSRDGRLLSKSAGSGELDSLLRQGRPGTETLPDSVLISSVAGQRRTQEIMDACIETWQVPVTKLESSAESAGIHNAYSEPQKLGVDRWLAIVGAATHYGKPVVVWDLGTATTLDAVDEDGRHTGGLILPGPVTMLESLKSGTRLEVPEFEGDGASNPDSEPDTGIPPGKSTRECILNGVHAAQLGALNQFMRNVGAGGRTPRLAVTGGAAGVIMSQLEIDHVFDPWLVFRGMLATSGGVAKASRPYDR